MPNDKEITLDLIKPSFQKSKIAFISMTGGKSSIFFSKYFSRTIGMVTGDNIAFYGKENNEEMKYIFGIYITKNKLHTLELKRSRNSDMFRVNSRKIAEQLQKAFRIKDGKTVRLMIDISNPHIMKENSSAEEVKMFMLYDLPPMREDMDEQERNNYNEDYINKMAAIKNYGFSDND